MATIKVPRRFQESVKERRLPGPLPEVLRGEAPEGQPEIRRGNLQAVCVEATRSAKEPQLPHKNSTGCKATDWRTRKQEAKTNHHHG